MSLLSLLLLLSASALPPRSAGCVHHMKTVYLDVAPGSKPPSQPPRGSPTSPPPPPPPRPAGGLVVFNPWQGCHCGFFDWKRRWDASDGD